MAKRVVNEKKAGAQLARDPMRAKLRRELAASKSAETIAVLTRLLDYVLKQPGRAKRKSGGL